MSSAKGSGGGGGAGKKRKKRTTLSVSVAARSAVGGSVTAVTAVRSGDRKQVISEYHTLVKLKEATLLQPASTEKKTKLADIEQKMETIGGLQRYQEASIKGHTGPKGAKFNTGKWVMEILRADASRSSLPPLPIDPERPPPLTETTRAANISVLDVGALTNHYLPYAHMVRCTAIDLNPCHPTVTKMDFFDLDPYKRSYDVVVLSLVVNFVGDKRKRGQMLADSWLLLSDRSTATTATPPPASSSSSSTAAHAPAASSVWCPRLFLILPRPCMDNSRYLTHDLFVTDCMLPLGFQLDAHKMSAGLAFYSFKRLPTRRWPLLPWKSSEIRYGAGHNNFAIVIDPDFCSPPLTSTTAVAAAARRKRQQLLAAAAAAANDNDDKDSDDDDGKGIVAPSATTADDDAAPAPRSADAKKKAKKQRQAAKKRARIAAS